MDRCTFLALQNWVRSGQATPAQAERYNAEVARLKEARCVPSKSHSS